MGLEEDFKTDQETRNQSKQYQLEQDFRAYLQDKAQGGSIRQAPLGEAGKENFPVGATVGGIGGALAGAVVGGPVGAVAGAGVGAAGGQFIQGRVEQATGNRLAPQTKEEELYRAAREAAWNSGMEGLGQLGGFLVPKIRSLAPFAPAVTPEAKAAMKFIHERGGPEYSLLPAEMTSNRFLDIMQNISEHSLFGGGAIQTFKQNRDAFNAQLAQGLVARYGPAMDADAIGRAVVDSARYNLEAAKFPAKMIYEAIESAAAPQYAKAPKNITVEKMTKPKMGKEAIEVPSTLYEPSGQLATKTIYQDIQVGEKLQQLKVMVTEQETQIGGARIDLRSIKDDIAGMSKTAETAGGLADTGMGNTLLSFMNKKPDMVSYPVAKAMRTEIRTYRDQLVNNPETKNAPGIAKANSIYQKLSDQIRHGLAEDDPFLATMWDEANLIEAGANQQFNTKMIRELVKLAEVRGANAPEAIVEKVWRADRPTQIKVVRNAVNSTTWQKFQAIELEQLMKDSFVENVPNGKKMDAAFFGKGGLGEDALQAGFDPGFVNEMKEFVKTLKTQEAKAPDNTGRIWIQLAQATAGFQAIGATMMAVGITSEEYGGKGLTGSGAAVLFAPAVLAQLMTRPGAIRWLTEGMSTSPGTKKWIMATTQLGKLLQAGIPRGGPETQDTSQTVPSTQVPGSPLMQ